MYQPQYCEENAYFLTRALSERTDAAFAVFISNTDAAVPFWLQKAGGAKSDGGVVWDYHVIVVTRGGDGVVDGGAPSAASAAPLTDGTGGAGGASLVWDLDSTLPFPTPLADYAEHGLRAHGSAGLPARFRRLYRVVPAAALLRKFASDRSHMRSGDGNWLAPPPPWEPIVSDSGETMNLNRWRCMDSPRDDGEFGVVMSEPDFLAFFFAPKR